VRPESRKETSKGAVAARARMLHAANLGWLEGFPLAVEDGSVRWLVVPPNAPPREIRVDGRHLSQATYALNKLRGELAPGLELLADDPQAWMASVEHRLALVKAAVHQGAPLPARLLDDPVLPKAQRRRLAEMAEARPLVDALSWLHAGDPAWTRPALDLARDWAAGFAMLSGRLGEQPALLLLLRLLQLAADHGRELVELLAACLFDERVHDVNLSRGEELRGQLLNAIGRRPKGPLPEEIPAGRLGGELARWCEELVQESRRAQDLSLRLFEAATVLPAVERWARWWDEFREILEEARVLRAHKFDKGISRRLRERLEAQKATVPPVVKAPDLMAALRRAAASGALRTAPLILTLSLIPPSWPGRLPLLIYWSFLGHHGGHPETRVVGLLAGFERYLSRRTPPDESWLRPWAEAVERPLRPYNDTPEHELLEEPRPRHQILAAYDYLAEVAVRRGGLDPEAATQALGLYLLTGEADLAARFFESLGTGETFYYRPDVMRLAARLCRERPERFGPVWTAVQQQEDAELSPTDWPASLVEALSTGEVGELVRESLVDRQVERLLSCCTKSVLLDAAGVRPLPRPEPGEPAEPDWIRRYPVQLQPALQRLAAFHEDAEARVARWLAADIPDPGRLEREIRVLEERIDAVEEIRRPALLTRLQNLRERLAHPSVPGEARLGRLLAKLSRAWGRAVLEGWERELDARLPEALGRLIGVEEPPSWLTEPSPLALLATATRLKPRDRALAYRLFRLRCGPPPWDLRDDPANRRFVEERPGIDWRPWMEGIGTVPMETANGRRLHLALEDDPLEIFRMGGRFQTCLSPGSVNYFSVFANAADINKRVLYARDDGGRVVGRCLLALTAGAELLTFTAYCHDGEAGFDALCTDFAEGLARRMGTRVVVHGKVPTLVASDWYDDGPRDLGHRFTALEEGSPLRRRLATMRPGELLAELRRGLKPARLDESTLPLILALPELQERPELAVPLLRPLAESRGIPARPVWIAVRLALRAGSADLARRLFARRLAGTLSWGYYSDPADLLLELDPGRLLAALRRSLETGVRDWLGDTDGERLAAAAAALDALHRPRQAEALWRRVATSPEVEAYKELRERARKELEKRKR
jgi:hypothetical protein